MAAPISNATQAQPVHSFPQRSTQKPVRPEPQSAAGTDTVQLSAAATAALAAQKEATETQAQTAQEANQGDPQAQRLLAKEAAAKPVTK